MVCRLVAGVLMQKPDVFGQHLPGGKSEMGLPVIHVVLTAKTAWFLQQLKQLVAKSPSLFGSLTNERNTEDPFDQISVFRFFNSAFSR